MKKEAGFENRNPFVELGLVISVLRKAKGYTQYNSKRGHKSAVPVSYTHLDVYKRQVMKHIRPEACKFKHLVVCDFIQLFCVLANTRIGSIDPVSYTHLDVYKRQYT